MTRARQLALLLFALSSTGAARADWLDHLPTCAIREPHVPTRTQLVYPRPGLPALVRPGETIVARVRLPVPLTPPPGIQQRRALRGWRAELIGQGHVIEMPAEHRYVVRVEDVRTDADTTLVFRATVRVPLWAAPGTYALAVDSPGSIRRVSPGSVRVVARDAPLVVRRLPSIPRGADLGPLIDAAVDLWVSDAPAPSLRAPLLGRGIPWVDLGQRGFIASWNGSSLVVGGCDDPGRPFEQVPRGDVLEAAEAPPWPSGGVEIEGRELHEQGGMNRVVSLVFPEDGRGRPVGRGARYYSATGVRPAGLHPSIVVVVPLGANETLRWGDAAGSLTLDLPLPDEIEVYRTTQLAPTTSAPARIGLAYEEDGAAYAPSGEELSLKFRWLGPQEVHALAIGTDGANARRQQTARVGPVLRTGCAASGSSEAGFLWVFAALCTIARRR